MAQLGHIHLQCQHRHRLHGLLSNYNALCNWCGTWPHSLCCRESSLGSSCFGFQSHLLSKLGCIQSGSSVSVPGVWTSISSPRRLISFLHESMGIVIFVCSQLPIRCATAAVQGLIYCAVVSPHRDRRALVSSRISSTSVGVYSLVYTFQFLSFGSVSQLCSGSYCFTLSTSASFPWCAFSLQCVVLLLRYRASFIVLS